MKEKDKKTYIIHCFDQFDLSLQHLMKASDKLGPVLDLEEKSLSEHNITSLEETLKEKKKVSEALNASMLQCQEKMHLCLDSIGSDQNKKQISLSQFSMIISHYTDSQSPVESPTPDAGCLARFRKASDDIKILLNRFTKNKLRTEKNRLITATLLKNHQESYQFWCELVKEKNSQYNEKGSVRRPENISQITIEA